MKQASFTYWFFGSGWSDKLPPGEQHNKSPDKMVQKFFERTFFLKSRMHNIYQSKIAKWNERNFLKNIEKFL